MRGTESHYALLWQTKIALAFPLVIFFIFIPFITLYHVFYLTILQFYTDNTQGTLKHGYVLVLTLLLRFGIILL